MKISVKNLGVLEHSEIDLSKKLNILCGANNTGKTYMAYLVYGWNYLCERHFNLFDNDLAINATQNKVFTLDLPHFANFKDMCNVLKKLLGEIFNQEDAFFQKTIIEVSNDFQEATKNRDKLLEERATRYPLPIRESLKIAEDLSRLSQEKSKYEYLAEEIEKKILKGKIKVNKYGEIQYAPSGTRNVNLPMHVSASMVKSLSSIVFYFRHLAQEGDLIIIDEPELNLHPDMQRAVARLLARFINEGFKVLISTHSDYIIKELNLLIMLNNPDKSEAKDLQKKYGYQDNELLKPEEIGVYLFKDKHSEIVKVSQEGFEIETIDKEINELNHAFKNIYFSLYN